MTDNTTPAYRRRARIVTCERHPNRIFMADANSGPENLSDVLGRLFVARGWGRVSERTRLEAAWAEVAGPELIAHTRVGGIKRGTLDIEVKSAVLQQELTQYHKRRILADLRAKLPGVTVADIKFRSGVW